MREREKRRVRERVLELLHKTRFFRKIKKVRLKIHKDEGLGN